MFCRLRLVILLGLKVADRQELSRTEVLATIIIERVF